MRGFGRLGGRLAMALIAAPAAALAVAGPASADKPLTVCASGCDYTTIQAAVDNAPNGATIQIAAGTFAGFSVPDTNISLSTLTLTGAGVDQTTISGGGPVVSIASGVSVKLSSVTVTGGSGTFGGGIANKGTLMLKSSVVSHNVVTGPFGVDEGGGIDNVGSLTLEGSVVSNNDGTFGAGIGNEGTMTLRNSTVSNNNDDTAGGGIENGGTATLEDSTVSGNRADAGGGFENLGTLTLKGSSVSSNSAFAGGAILNQPGGTVTLKSSTVSSNTTFDGGDGGGLFNVGTATLDSSTVTGNIASGDGGGIWNSATVTLNSTAVTGNVPDNCAGPSPVPGC